LQPKFYIIETQSWHLKTQCISFFMQDALSGALLTHCSYIN